MTINVAQGRGFAIVHA